MVAPLAVNGTSGKTVQRSANGAEALAQTASGLTVRRDERLDKGPALEEVTGPLSCSVVDCSSPVLAKDLCRLHYGRQRRLGDPLAVPKHKFYGNQIVSVARKENPHGTNARYAAGCFCALCVAAHSQECRDYKRAKDPLVGTRLDRKRERAAARREAAYQSAEIIQILRAKVANNWRSDLAPHGLVSRSAPFDVEGTLALVTKSCPRVIARITESGKVTEDDRRAINRAITNIC